MQREKRTWQPISVRRNLLNVKEKAVETTICIWLVATSSTTFPTSSSCASHSNQFHRHTTNNKLNSSPCFLLLLLFFHKTWKEKTQKWTSITIVWFITVVEQNCLTIWCNKMKFISRFDYYLNKELRTQTKNHTKLMIISNKVDISNIT